jgi:hypothetical protein
MREDMNKVLTERPRTGGRGKQSKRFERDSTPREKRVVPGIKNIVKVDLSPKKESMRKRHKVGGDYKKLSDLLGPLANFLLSRVGKKWDDVWSEICKVLKGNGLQANHVKDHVKDYVGGVGHGNKKDSMWRFGRPESHFVYVDENGILREGEKFNKSAYRRKKKIYPHVIESKTVEYHKINGCWYRITQVPAIHPVDNTPYFELVKEALNRNVAKKLNLVNRLATKPSQFYEVKK